MNASRSQRAQNTKRNLLDLPVLAASTRHLTVLLATLSAAATGRRLAWRLRWSPGLFAWAAVFLGVMIAPATIEAQSVTFVGLPVISGLSSPRGIATDQAGNVYIADSNNNRVLKLSPNGTQSTVGTGLSYPAFVAVDAAGDVFISDSQNRIVEISASGTQTTLASLSGVIALAADGVGNVFVSTNDGQDVVKISANGTQATISSNSDVVTGLATDAAGDVFISDFYYPYIRKVQPSGAQSQIGAGLESPGAIALDASGDIFVDDWGTNSIVEISATGPQTTQISNLPQAVFLAVDRANNLLISDGTNGQVLRFPPNGVVSFAPTNVCAAGQNTPAPCSQTLTLAFQVSGTATLGSVQVLTDGTPNLDFTLASGNTCTGALTNGSTCAVNVTFAPRFAGVRRGAVQVTDSNGNVLATTYVYGDGVGPEIAFGGGIPTPVVGNLKNPAGAAVDAAGNVFVADPGNGRVLKIAANGVQSTVGTGLSQPAGVAVDAAGNVFIADMSATSIIEVHANGGPQINLGSGLYLPSGVAVDGALNLYIADTGNGRVLRISPRGTQTSIGSGWMKPAAVAVDAAGDVWVADLDQTQLVKVAADGTQTLVGTGLNQPCGLAIDAAGDVLVTNKGGNAVEIYPDGSQATLGSALNATTGVALDGAGDIFIAESNGNLVELQRSQPPAFNFPSTAIGSTSSPQSLAIENIGNAPLMASNLSIGSNFGQVPGSGSPADCTSSFSLVPGASCSLSIAFAPTAVGSLQSTAVLTDNSLNGSPATQSLTLTGVGQQASQTINFTLPATAYFGNTITLAASASSGLPVSFASTTNGVCTVSGTTASMVGVGTCSIQATQAGNANYSAAPPVSQNITVGVASQTITFTGLPATATYGSAGPYTLNATASSRLAVTYTVTGPASLTGSTLTITGAGTVVVTAAQAGNANYAAAKPVTQSFTVNPAGGFTITPIPGSETVYPGVSAAGYLLQLKSVNGFSGKVKLSCSGSVTPSACVDLPQTVTISGTTYAITGISFPASTKPGTYTITFTGVSGSITSTATATFTVKAK